MHLYIYVSFLPLRNFEKRDLVTPLWDTDQPEPPETASGHVWPRTFTPRRDSFESIEDLS
jgi:hypothetical protein